MTTVVKDRFEETRRRIEQLFHNWELQLNGQAKQPLHQLRQAALKRLGELPFPTRRDEDWKYTPVTRVLNQDFQEVDQYPSAKSIDWPLSDIQAARITFINGRLIEQDTLPEGVQVMPVSEAFERPDLEKKIRDYFEYWTTEETNPFVALNAAMAGNGLFIHVEKNAVVETPLLLQHWVDGQDKAHIVQDQSFVWAEANSQAMVIQTYQGKGNYFQNVVNRLDIDQNAHFKHIRFQRESRDGFQISHTEARQAKDSTYSNYGADLGGRLVRNDLNAIHQGEGVHTDYYGIYLANDRQHVDNHTFIDHALPNCTSNELYKGIIDDRATGVFNGKVLVRQDAQKTNAFQQNSNLLLSDRAVMDSKPQLEIFADDVKCSHGATIGQLDEEAVFYLRSRGISDVNARKLLQSGFLGEVIEAFPVEALRDHLGALITQKLG